MHGFRGCHTMQAMQAHGTIAHCALRVRGCLTCMFVARMARSVGLMVSLFRKLEMSE